MSILGRDPEISKIGGHAAYIIALGLAVVNIRYSVNFFQAGTAPPAIFSIDWFSSWLPACAMSVYEAAFAAVLTTPEMHDTLMSIPERVKRYQRGTRQKIYLWAIWVLAVFMCIALFGAYRYDCISTFGALEQAGKNPDAILMMTIIFVFGSEVLIVAGNASKWAGLIGEAATSKLKKELLNDIDDAKNNQSSQTTHYNGSAHASSNSNNRRTPNR